MQILFKLKGKKKYAFKSRLTNCYWKLHVIENEKWVLDNMEDQCKCGICYFLFFFFQILMLGWLLTWVIADKVVFLMFELDCYWKWIMGFWNGIDVYKISEYKVLVFVDRSCVSWWQVPIVVQVCYWDWNLVFWLFDWGLV